MTRFRVEVYRSVKTREYWSRIRGANGRILYTSEMYKTKRAAVATARLVAAAFRVEVDDKTKVSAGN